MKSLTNSMVLACFLTGCCGVHQPIESAHSDELKRFGKLRENMTRSQVERILRPTKTGYGIIIGGMEHGFYWLSPDSGVWLDYMRKNDWRERQMSPSDIFVSSPKSLELSVMDQTSGKWTHIQALSK